MIQVNCECGRVIKAHDNNAGKRVKCPDCGEIVRLPGAASASHKGDSPRPRTKEEAASKSNTSKVRKAKPSDDDDFEDLPPAEYADDDDDELPSPRRTRKKTGTAGNRGDSDDAKSSKKKKKGAKAGAQSNKTLLIAGGIAGGVAVLAIGITAVIFMSSKKSTSATAANEAAAPRPLPELENFSTEQRELTCLAPKGWEVSFGGGQGGVPVFATFEKGQIKIQYRSSPSGTQVGAIAQAGNQDPQDLPEEMRPVSVAHDYQKGKFAAEVSGYQEKGEPKMFKCAGFGGEGRLSIFTAKEGLYGQVFGYRATLLGVNNQWNVVCKCPAADWKVCQPLFLKILESSSGN